MRVAAHYYLHGLKAEEIHAVVLSVVANKKLRLGTLLQHHQDTPYSHKGSTAAQKVHKLHRFAQFAVFRHIDQQTVLTEKRVESHFRVLHIGHSAVIFPDYRVILCQRPHVGTLGEVVQRGVGFGK